MSKSASDNSKKKVCFICGSYTTLVLNIYERRCGPNIIDVINEKFKVQPLSDDKFVCYSCNNWLINWHSLQNSSGESSNKSSSNLPKSSKSIPEEQDANMVVLSNSEHYFTSERLREKLKKYLYTPKRITFRQSKPQFRRYVRCKCNLCGISLKKDHLSLTTKKMFLKNKCLRFCSKCKRSLERFFNDQNQTESNCYSKNVHRHYTGNGSSQNRKLVNPCVVSRLKKLGTTLMREDSSTNQCSRNRFPYRKYENDFTDEQRSSSCSNEIVLSFNTTLTEVFPLDLTLAQPDTVMKDCAVKTKDINEMIRQIPKSLSISLLA